MARKNARVAQRAPQRGSAIGRGGEVITREVTGIDQYEVPAGVIENGWSYQWCCESVYNRPETAQMNAMHRAGWRPVHIDSDDGDDACVRRDGLILMERPESLTHEANAEDSARARQQLRDSTSRFDTTLQLPRNHHQMQRIAQRGAPEPITRDLLDDSGDSIISD